MAGKSSLTVRQILHGLRLGAVLVLSGVFLLGCVVVGFTLGAVMWVFNAPTRVLGRMRGRRA